MIVQKDLPVLECNIKNGKVLVGSDFHIPFQDKDAVDCFIDKAIELQPEAIVINGDLLDFYRLSKFAKGEGRNPMEEIIEAQTILKILRTKCPNSKIFYPIGNHECFEKETEVLTKEFGWIKIADIINNNLENFHVINYNTKKDILEYDKVLGKTKSYTHSLLNIETANTKQVVTFNHEVLINKTEKVLAQDITIEDLNKKIINNSILPNPTGVGLTDDEIKLITWVCADGCIVWEKPRIQFKLSKIEKIEELKNLLDKMEIPFTFKECKKTGPNKLQPYYIRIYGDYARKIVSYFDEYKKKELPKNFRNINKEQFEILLNTIIKTDGYSKEQRIYFYSNNKNNLDIIQELAVKNGYSCRIEEQENNGFIKRKPVYKAMLTKNYQYVKFLNKIEYIENYNDCVYCLTTSNGTLVTRHSGKVAITGNCRLEKYIYDKAPEIASIVENFYELLKCKDIEVQGCHKVIFNNEFICKHGSIVSQKAGQTAIKEMERSYTSGATGHTHRLIKYITRKAEKKFVWLETGCLCTMKPEYMLEPDWQQGFALVEFKKGKLYKADVFEIENGKVL